MSESQRLVALLDLIKNYRVVVIGETIIDEYEYVIPMGKPPKEAIIAARYQSSESFAGGAVIVANVLASCCKSVKLVTSVGNFGGSVVAHALEPNVDGHLVCPERQTIVKKRYVDQHRNRKLFETYHIDDSPLPDSDDLLMRDIVDRLAEDSDLCIIADFGHGLISESFIEYATGSLREGVFVAATVQTNTANFGFNLATKYGSGLDYLCIDETEARLALVDNRSNAEDLGPRLSIADVWAVTRGSKGCIIGALPAKGYELPSVAKDVVDTVGTGDAFLAVTAPLVKAGVELQDVGLLGNIAGALKSRIVGQRSYVTKDAMIKAIGELCPNA